MYLLDSKTLGDSPLYSRIIFGGEKKDKTMTKQEAKLFEKGERIITRGDVAECAYLILEGKVNVYLEKDEKKVTLSELGAGAIFGESAIFEGKTYSANVDAAEDTKLMVITPENFREKIDKCDPMLRAIIAMLMDRQDRTNQALLRSETRELVEVAMV